MVKTLFCMICTTAHYIVERNALPLPTHQILTEKFGPNYIGIRICRGIGASKIVETITTEDRL